MNTIFNIQPFAHIKALSKALFSFLLVASFLASCTIEEPAEIINNIGDRDPPTLTCPSDGAGITGATITWDEPTLANDPTGTTLEVSTAPADATDISTTGATFPTATNYTVTVTAMDGSTAFMVNGAELTCTFMVSVTETADTTDPEIMQNTCTDITHTPELPFGTTSIAISDLSTAPAVTATDESGLPPVITYTPDPITLSEGTSTNTVTATARDASDNEAMCTFDVIVTVAADDTTVVELLFSLATPDTANSASNPFLISNAADLSNLAMAVNSDSNYTIGSMTPASYRSAAYRLESDIALTGTANNFTPIGTTDNPFSGTFVGVTDSNTISGLYFSNDEITDASSTNVGLFGVISGSTTSISNLILTGINITGRSNVGGLVGTMLDSSSISNVSAAGSVTGTDRIGGLVGQLESMSSITSASASAEVYATANIGGGLVGLLNASSITNAFALGEVTGNTRLGGLVGQMTNSSIINAYASGDIGINDIYDFRGGLIGTLEGTSSLTNTLAWGEVIGNSATGSGLVGSQEGSARITASYWDRTVNSALGFTIDNNAQDTTDLQMPQSAIDIYTNWNNTDSDTTPGAGDVWNFGTGTEYPRLNVSPVSVECQRDSDSSDDCPNK